MHIRLKVGPIPLPLIITPDSTLPLRTTRLIMLEDPHMPLRIILITRNMLRRIIKGVLVVLCMCGTVHREVLLLRRGRRIPSCMGSNRRLALQCRLRRPRMRVR